MNLASQTTRTLAALLLAAGTALAQDLTPKAGPQRTPITIYNATIHPVGGPDIPKGFITFDKGMITEVGTGDPATAPAKTAIDAKGAHVYPGLIAAVTRLGLGEIPTVRAMRDSDELGDITPETKALVAVNPDSTLLPVTRVAGVLSVGVFPSGGLVGGQPALVRLDGWTTEDMAITPSLGLLISYPSARPVSGRRFSQVSTEDQLRDIKKNLDALDEVFKTAGAYAAARDADPSTPIDIRWESMRRVFPSSAASQAAPQSSVFIQASDADQITQAVQWAVAQNLKPVIIGGRDAPMVADLLKRHHVPVILEGVHAFPKRDDAPYDSTYRLPAQLESLGVTWCLASGEETPHERNLAANAGRAAAYGLARDAALRSITLGPAQILGAADRLGSLEKGKYATLFISDGDILEITTRVTRAYIDGREIDLTTKQSKLNDKYRERYRQMGIISEGKSK